MGQKRKGSNSGRTRGPESPSEYDTNYNLTRDKAQAHVGEFTE